MNIRYSGEIAAQDACKIMYLSACLLTGHTFQEIKDLTQYQTESIGQSKSRKFSYMKKQNLKSYGYVVEAIKLLQE